MAYNWDQINAQAAQGLAPKGPGIGEQLATKAATNIAAKEAAKLGLGAAGTAIGGPAGGALGTAAGELAGPLAGQLVSSLFNKGGPVGNFEQWLANTNAPLVGREDHPAYNAYKDVYNSLPKSNEAPAKQQAPAPKAPTTRGTANWDIPLGELLGANISTQGGYTDMSSGDDPWNAGLKASWSFDKGGKVPSGKKSSIWDSVKKAASYAWKNDNLKDPKHSWSHVGQNAKTLNKGGPVYKEIGGMTKGPLGMSDMLMAGKDKDISKVKMKKTKGDMSEEMEYSYHAPLAAKPKGE